MENVIIKTKDWVSPFGEHIGGVTYKGILVKPTDLQVRDAKEEGFTHLLNGDFVWLKRESGKLVHIYVENVIEVLKFVGDSYHKADLAYKGKGSFEVNIVE